MSKVDTVILGAGLTGLAAALSLESDYILLEKNSRPGGLTRTEKIDGYLFDHTGHWLHLRNERTQALVKTLLGDNLMEVSRNSKIYSHGNYIEYPFQSNLGGLPKDIAFECLWDAIEAHLERNLRPEPKNFEEFSRTLFGNGITDHFLVSYNHKLWGCEPREITAEWCGRFFPKPNLEQITKGALGLTKATGYNAKFVYPKQGGIEALPRSLASQIDSIQTDSAPDALHLGERWLEVKGDRIHYRRLISSIPLPELLKIVLDLPEALREAASWLRCTKLRYVNYGVKGKVLNQIHWLYLPEPQLPFYRIGCSSNAIPTLAPPGCSSLYVEVSNDHNLPDAEVLSAIRHFFQELGVISSEADIEVEAVRHIPYGYVIFDDHYDEAREHIFPYLENNGVMSRGRYGAWIYSSMEDALLDGLKAGDIIREERKSRTLLSVKE
ncbi:MAG: NAD(P)-binding protein [Symploca sp. SIO2C1]|nr:NAD(P)-binding protein [Symploca sp. SIO2C1]